LTARNDPSTLEVDATGPDSGMKDRLRARKLV
jgi:hypothetical protein